MRERARRYSPIRITGASPLIPSGSTHGACVLRTLAAVQRLHVLFARLLVGLMLAVGGLSLGGVRREFSSGNDHALDPDGLPDNRGGDGLDRIGLDGCHSHGHPATCIE